MKGKQDLMLEFIKFLAGFTNCILFSYVWVLYYNDQAFSAHWLTGTAVTCGIYVFLYLCFSRLYQAFKIGTCQIGELIFSQILSFGIADLIIYAECCLMHGGYVNLVPGLFIAGLQILSSSLWMLGAKRYFIEHIPAKRTLLLSGHREPENNRFFCDKLTKKLGHMFDIREIRICEENICEILQERKDAFDTVLLYDVPAHLRSGILTTCVELEKEIYMTPRIDDIFLLGCEGKHLIDTPLMRYSISQKGRREAYPSKRLWDIAISGVLLLICSPIMALVALAIKLEDGGPVIFRQDRVTLHGKVFSIYKFRSMIVDAEKNGAVIPCKTGDPRITKVGRFIRKTRLDELPQLLNILKGDMSIVGPRPERVEHVEKYTAELPEFTARLQVRGGLTGYAQVYGKYNTSAEDKLKLDLLYIENMSLWMDLKLVFLTVKIMFIPESTEGFGGEESV